MMSKTMVGKTVWECKYGCWSGARLPRDGCPSCGCGVYAVDFEAAAAELRGLGSRMSAAELRAYEEKARRSRA